MEKLAYGVFVVPAIALVAFAWSFLPDDSEKDRLFGTTIGEMLDRFGEPVRFTTDEDDPQELWVHFEDESGSEFHVAFQDGKVHAYGFSVGTKSACD